MKYLLSLSMVLLLCGCGSNRQIEQELSTATRLLRIEPDSSLRIIENIAPDRILRRSTRAKYAPYASTIKVLINRASVFLSTLQILAILRCETSAFNSSCMRILLSWSLYFSGALFSL